MSVEAIRDATPASLIVVRRRHCRYFVAARGFGALWPRGLQEAPRPKRVRRGSKAGPMRYVPAERPLGHDSWDSLGVI
eukprot:6298398-Pyramimonas_sp.AAC.1